MMMPAQKISLLFAVVSLMFALITLWLLRTTLTLEPGASVNWSEPLKMVLAVCLFAAMVYVHHLLQKRAKRQSRSENIARSKTWLYYSSAIKFCGIVAAADAVNQPEEFAAMGTSFNIDPDTFPNARGLYQQQFRKPEPIKSIARHFVKAYGKGSAACETLVLGICELAMADGSMHVEEFQRISEISAALGVNVRETTRILYAAGYQGDVSTERPTAARGRFGRKGGGAPVAPRAQTERGKHLAILGLGPSADMAQVRKSHRALARKHHPDKLISQNLPADEMAKAEAMMQTINEAYDWLKEHE